MSNSFFKFKAFTIQQNGVAMKVTTDSCLFGAWAASEEMTESFDGLSTVNSILDIGTGTGLLCLMLAQKTSAKIEAVEIEEKAFLQAVENINASPWSAKINILKGDATKISFEKRYDLIISNPPFYENDLKSKTENKNKAFHDETLLLKDLLTIIRDNLSPSGRFYILLPFKRWKEARLLFEEYQLCSCKLVKVRPSPEHAFSRVMIAGAAAGVKAVPEKELNIKTGTGVYSPEFEFLLKDFYLQF